MEIDFLKTALQNSNVKALLLTIRQSELGTTSDDGYQFLFGSTPSNTLRFTDFSQHPNRRTPYTNKAGQQIISTAAGAYQILFGTWKGLAAQLGLTDFSPANQDLAAVELLSQKNCVTRLMEGEFSFALSKAKEIWASLPGANDDQPEHTLAEVTQWYTDAGGTIIA